MANGNAEQITQFVKMTDTELKIVRFLCTNVPYTLCDMYGHLRGNVDNCEIDGPLGDLCDRGIVRTVGKQRCMRGDRCMSCGDGGTLAYVLAKPAMPSLPDTGVQPTRPLPPSPLRATSEQNAEQIGELQARVSQLEGQVTFLMGALSALQKNVIKLQDMELKRLQDRIDASKESVPE